MSASGVAGFDQVVLDEAARQSFAAGAFEETVEDGAAIVEEFYPDEFDSESRTVFDDPTADHAFARSAGNEAGGSPVEGLKPALADKLNQKAARINGYGVPVSPHPLPRQVPHDPDSCG